jgi:hypothetical protein
MEKVVCYNKPCSHFFSTFGLDLADRQQVYVYSWRFFSMKKLVLAALVCGSFTAYAGEAKKAHADHGDAAFKALDKDADGAVTAEEAAGNAELTAAWATVDKDGDKKVSAAEFKAFEKTEKKAKK